MARLRMARMGSSSGAFGDNELSPGRNAVLLMEKRSLDEDKVFASWIQRSHSSQASVDLVRMGEMIWRLSMSTSN